MDPVSVMVALGIAKQIADMLANRIRQNQQLTAADMEKINREMREARQQWQDLAPEPPQA